MTTSILAGTGVALAGFIAMFVLLKLINVPTNERKSIL